jgi:excisionase family DNA binding protein
MEKLWTTSEAAKYLGVDEVDVEQLAKDGKLTGYKLGGQFLRFRPEQVKQLKAQGVATAAAGRGERAGADDPWLDRLRDLWYFYDFYAISFAMLAVLIVYLIQ